MKLRYAVVFEQTPNNYAAYVPDVPGCVSTGKTWDEMLAMIREALAFHIEAMLEDGEPLPSRGRRSTRRSRTTANPSPRTCSTPTGSSGAGPHDLDPVRDGRDRGSRPASCQGGLTVTKRTTLRWQRDRPKYAAVIERTGNGYSAYIPDLPGCVAAGDTRAETEALIREAVVEHLEVLRESGDLIPEPQASISLVDA